MGVPVSTLGGKLAEYEEKAKLIDAWAQDSDAEKLTKPGFLLHQKQKRRLSGALRDGSKRGG